MMVFDILDTSKRGDQMFKNKKAQGLSLNTIIIASLVLIVLVVLILVFTGRISIFGEGVDEVTTLKDCPGEIQDNLPCEEDLTYSIGPWEDVSAGKYCCI